jgi:hypothetical protein
MKHSTILLSLIILVTTFSCNFSVGVKKDLSTGLLYENNGFGVQEVAFLDPNGERATNNEVALNTEVAIVAQGLTNYTLKDSMAHPGLSLVVKDKAGNPVIDEADLFPSSEGFSPEDASAIRGTITIGTPMQSGKTYDVMMRVWDKNNPDHHLTVTMEIVVK